MTSSTLKPWYAVATPHEDIREGRLSEAVFAANLWAVVLETVVKNAAIEDIAAEVYIDPVQPHLPCLKTKNSLLKTIN